MPPTLSVLLPVLGRPHRAQVVVDSIRSNTEVDHEIIFLCNRSDYAESVAVLDTGARMFTCDWEPGPGDYAKKINYGFRSTSSPYLFLGADDLEWHAGWETHAIKLAEKTGAGVIGTQDDANPMVKAGKHSTHSMVTRAYIDEVGGTWHDGPGIIYHEGYDHQWPDNELCQAAMDRGRWAFSKLSLVRHLHPYFGGGMKMDDTYRKALAHGREDAEIYRERERRARARS